MLRFAPICLALALAAPAAAQPPEKRALYQALDDIHEAIRADDWDGAWRAATALGNSLHDHVRKDSRLPELELQHLEQLAGRDAATRAPLLPRLAHAAYAAGNRVKAERYANDTLEAATHGVFPWTGDAIHQGNIVLGHLALLRGDQEAARHHLLAAGKTPGSSTLDSQGPNMSLARDLLYGGDTETVLQYLEECRNFWNGSRGKLAEWIVLIRGGLKPDFGVNVGY